ncbi:MAG: hypothetical protein QM610_15905 [Chitinophagaceae bacterium]
MDRPNLNEVKRIACVGTHPFLHSILLLIVFFCLGSLENAHGQTLKITGHVSDKDGKLLAGVTVINLKTGTGTDGSLKRADPTSIDQIWVYTKQSLKALKHDYVYKTRPFNSYNSLFPEVKSHVLKA